MTLAILVLAAAFLDAVTMTLLPHGSELNPIAATVPLLGIGLKLTVAFAVARLVYARHRYFRGVGIVAAAAWLVGVAANVAVLA